jgi:hypothetical protein
MNFVGAGIAGKRAERCKPPLTLCAYSQVVVGAWRCVRFTSATGNHVLERQGWRLLSQRGDRASFSQPVE